MTYGTSVSRQSRHSVSSQSIVALTGFPPSQHPTRISASASQRFSGSPVTLDCAAAVKSTSNNAIAYRVSARALTDHAVKFTSIGGQVDTVYQHSGPLLDRPWVERRGKTWELTEEGQRVWPAVADLVDLNLRSPRSPGGPCTLSHWYRMAWRWHAPKIRPGFRRFAPCPRTRCRRGR
jgi:hypothetical protein